MYKYTYKLILYVFKINIHISRGHVDDFEYIPSFLSFSLSLSPLNYFQFYKLQNLKFPSFSISTVSFEILHGLKIPRLYEVWFDLIVSSI